VRNNHWRTRRGRQHSLGPVGACAVHRKPHQNAYSVNRKKIAVDIQDYVGTVRDKDINGAINPCRYDRCIGKDSPFE
jgi:hypothetical protein